MASFQSLCIGASAQSDLESKLNDELNTLVIASLVSSSLFHASDGSNKGELVFALGTGDKYQVKLFSEGGIDSLQTSMQGWIDGANVILAQLAFTYGDNDNRAMLIYKSLLTGGGYSVKGISTSQASNMQDQVNTVIENKSEVISDSTFGGGNFRTVLITKG